MSECHWDAIDAVLADGKHNEIKEFLTQKVFSCGDDIQSAFVRMAGLFADKNAKLSQDITEM